MKKRINLTVNGQERELFVEARETLLDALRYDLGLTGTKEGCGDGNCGSCTVLLNGQAVNSCLVFAVEADGQDVLTIEGLGQDGKLHPLQEVFIEEGAIQCGFCTPGIILTAKAFLDSNPRPTE
ncbi:MAG: (2Fe-2S)-binding protein, partial [Syntrophorhabdales bacterium]